MTDEERLMTVDDSSHLLLLENLMRRKTKTVLYDKLFLYCPPRKRKLKASQ